MGKKLLKLIMLFAVACISFSCRNSDDIDNNTGMYSNIDSLYAQPLPVIQKCVEGKWKWNRTYQFGINGIVYPTNTFVDITKDKVVVKGEYSIKYSYSWRKKDVSSGYATYVIWNNEQNRSEWYFDKIQNDSLYVGTDGDQPFYASHLFIKVK